MPTENEPITVGLAALFQRVLAAKDTRELETLLAALRLDRKASATIH